MANESNDRAEFEAVFGQRPEDIELAAFWDFRLSGWQGRQPEIDAANKRVMTSYKEAAEAATLASYQIDALKAQVAELQGSAQPEQMSVRELIKRLRRGEEWRLDADSIRECNSLGGEGKAWEADAEEWHDDTLATADGLAALATRMKKRPDDAIATLRKFQSVPDSTGCVSVCQDALEAVLAYFLEES